MPHKQPRPAESTEPSERDADLEAFRDAAFKELREGMFGHIPHVEPIDVDPAVAEPQLKKLNDLFQYGVPGEVPAHIICHHEDGTISDGAGNEVRMIKTEDGRTEYVMDGLVMPPKEKVDPTQANKSNHSTVAKAASKVAGEAKDNRGEKS